MEVETGLVPSLVPYGFVNVGIEAEAFRREGVEILEVVGEGRVTVEDLNCLCLLAVCLLDLKLKERNNSFVKWLNCSLQTQISKSGKSKNKKSGLFFQLAKQRNVLYRISSLACNSKTVGSCMRRRGGREGVSIYQGSCCLLKHDFKNLNNKSRTNRFSKTL